MEKFIGFLRSSELDSMDEICPGTLVMDVIVRGPSPVDFCEQDITCDSTLRWFMA